MNLHQCFAFACLGLTSVVGCGAEGAPDTGLPPIASAPQVTVVRYTAEELAALEPGETVRVDLDALDKVYVVQYANPSDLAHVLVIDGNTRRVLGEVVPATAQLQVQEGTTNQVVLSGDPELAKEFTMPSGSNVEGRTMSTEEGEIGTVSQPALMVAPKCCDWCSCTGGNCVCGGCVDC
jgi:hypothetical protein